MEPWIIFALGAALSWGLYGPALHSGQVALGSPMRALLCVGIAYFLIGVIVPVITLSSQGQLNGFTMKGSIGAGLGGAVLLPTPMWSTTSVPLPDFKLNAQAR